MVVTGEFPSNANGREQRQNFVLDPVICSRSRTAAAVELIFTDANGAKFKVRRCASVSAERNGDEWNRIFNIGERTIVRFGQSKESFNDNKKINGMMSRLLGVSKPVLDKVVLVRQEEASWPLGDVGVVKQIMDSLVSATGYATALKRLNLCQKEQDVKRSEAADKVTRLLEQMKKLEELKEKIVHLNTLQEECNSNVMDLDAVLAALKTKQQEANEIEQQYREQGHKLDILSDRKKGIEDALMRSNGNAFDVRSDLSDVDLRYEIEKLESSLESRGRLRSDLTTEDLESDIEREEENKSSLREDEQKLKEEIHFYDHHIKRLEQKKKDLLHLSNEIGTDVLPSLADDIDVWTGWLQSLVADASKREHKVKEESDINKNRAHGALKDTQSSIDQLRKSQRKVSQRLEGNKERLSTTQQQLSEIPDSLRSSFEQSRAELESCRSEWKRNESRVPILEKELESLRKSIKTTESTLKEIADRSSNQAEANALFHFRCQAELLAKGRVIDASKELSSLLLSSIDTLDAHAGGKLHELKQTSSQLLTSTNNLSMGDVQRRHRDLARIKQKILHQKKDLLLQSQRRQNRAEASYELARQLRDGAEKHLQGQKAKFPRVTWNVPELRTKLQDISVDLLDGGVNFERESLRDLFPEARGSSLLPFRFDKQQIVFTQRLIRQIDFKIEESAEDKLRLQTGVSHAKKDLEEFEIHRICPACGIHEPDQVENMRAKLKSRVTFYEDSRNMDFVKRKLGKLQQAKQYLTSLHVQLSAARSIDSAQEELRTLEERLSNCETDMQRARGTNMLNTQRLGPGSQLDNIPSKSENLEHLLDQWKSERQKMAELRGQDQLLGGVRARQDVDALHEMKRSQERKAEGTRQELRRLDLLKNDFSEAKSTFLELREKFKAEKRIREEETYLSSSVAADESEIERLKREIESEGDKLFDRSKRYATEKNTADVALREARSVTDLWKSRSDEWHALLSSIPGYNRTEKDAELSQKMLSLQESDRNLASKRTQLESLKQDQTRRASLNTLRLQENFRKNCEDIREKKLLIGQLKANGDPTARASEVVQDILQKKSERTTMTCQRDARHLELQGLQNELVAMEEEALVKKLNECRIDKQLSELASSDLENYYQGLNQALADYHALKMGSINRTISELWREAYRGNDIDDIELVSGDQEQDKSQAMRRNFKYSVYMRQGQSRVDMRGRCSAGQEVLACLVIRLALVESFSKDLGILALDQPTANLDREHVESFAVALRAIIENRRAQGKFQLLLFTHDEEFLEMLGAQDFCDNWYTISKDANGLSTACLTSLQGF